ncbi:MAG: sensor histidine kinase [Nocardioidaceae bacterium]
MTSSPAPDPRPALLQGTPGRGRFGVSFAAVWLLFLADPAQQAWAQRAHPTGWLAMADLVAFAVVYIAVFRWARMRRHALEGLPPRSSLPSLSAVTALAVVLCLLVGQSGTAASVYCVVIGVLLLPGRWALGYVVAVAAALWAAARWVPSWTPDSSILLAVLAAALAMYGVQQMLLRNVDLVAAREENALLAVQQERNRFARDLHDILGHSLTVITVKAELAGKLFEADPGRAREELADLERLSRDALADVRRAVEGYRDVSLAGELARARLALAAADIEADLPHSAEEVPTELRELFAWTVREGVTNVIRHSGARVCSIRLSAAGVEIRDDGAGPAAATPGGRVGHGLIGLRERAAAVGAVLVTRALDPRGFLLEVTARGLAR